MASLGRKWASPFLHISLLLALCFSVYSNNFHHDWNLDDSHMLRDNPGIRTLSNIPKFFVDPSLHTIIRSNVDYRPVLEVTYALSYRMGRYNTWWWHFTQILLHFACVVGLYFLCRKVITLVPSLRDEPDLVRLVPLFAAMFFALNPTASGVINYFSARSSLLTAAFLFPSVLLYMVPVDNERYGRTPWLAVVCFALAMFTKVEAIGCLAVYFLYDVWQTSIVRKHQSGFVSDIANTLNARTLRRLWPFLVVAAVYFLVRAKLMAPFDYEQSRRATGVTSVDYLLTQTVVWWRYLLNWFAPINLVADNGNYPVYRSLLQGPVLLAVGGWLAVGAGLIALWKTRPHVTFLAFSALALISPTSSVAVLAEMLNEHRPYMPIAVLSLCWMIPLGALAVRNIPTHRLAGVFWGLGAVITLGGLGKLTWERNRVYATTRSYLEDLVVKAPSARTLNNYGLIFMQEGNFPKALEYFTDALKYAPNWHVIHTNLAIAYDGTGNAELARQHFDLAVANDPFSSTALTWRAENHLKHGRFREAVSDFDKARPKSLEHYRLCKGLATAYAGLGDAERSFEYTRECLALDRNQAVLDATTIVKPFFDSTELAAPGLRYFEAYDKVMPDTWWIQANIATLAGRLGDTTRMRVARARSDSLKSRQ